MAQLIENRNEESFRFNINDVVLCYCGGPVLYEAKCLDRRKPEDSEAEYYLHYLNWKSRYDEWVVESLVVECNKINLIQMAELKQKYFQKKKNGIKKNGIRKFSVEKHIKTKKQSQKAKTIKSNSPKKDDKIDNQLWVKNNSSLKHVLPEKSSKNKKNERESSPEKTIVKKKRGRKPKITECDSPKKDREINHTLLAINNIKLNQIAQQKRGTENVTRTPNEVNLVEDQIEKKNLIGKQKSTSDSFVMSKRIRQGANKESEVNSSGPNEENVINIFHPEANKTIEVITLESDEEPNDEIVDLTDDIPKVDLTGDNDQRRGDNRRGDNRRSSHYVVFNMYFNNVCNQIRSTYCKK